MNSTDQPTTSGTDSRANQAPPGELLHRVEQSRAELARRQAVTQSLGELARALDQAGQEADRTSGAGRGHGPGQDAGI